MVTVIPSYILGLEEEDNYTEQKITIMYGGRAFKL